MKFCNSFEPLVAEVRELYKTFRKSSKSREEAIVAVKDFFADEMTDSDDRLAVWIGLTLALCEKRELVKSVAEETGVQIKLFRQLIQVDDSESQYLSWIESLLEDETLQGAEARYRVHKPYKPDWEVGDLFAHTLTYPGAEASGIMGWSVLFYKIGEYQDMQNRSRQLMYVSLCPPGKEPASTEDLQKLGFLPMMKHGNKWDYIVQLNIKSKKTEMGYEFTEIGHFPGIIPPADRTEEDPFVSMPMFGHLSKDDVRPSYEDHICLLYRQFGKYLSKGQEDS